MVDYGIAKYFFCVTGDLLIGNMRKDQAENPGIICRPMLSWRFFFYANERSELIHVHCRKADAEAKYWLDIQGFETIEAHAYNMSNRKT